MIRSIPVIDLESPQVSDAFLRAYGDVGFAYLEGHGIPEDLVARAFEASASFHALPLEEKLALTVNAQHRGYMPFAESMIVSSSIQKATKPNLSESLMVMHEVDPGDLGRREDPLAGPNQWPAIPGFREAITAYEVALQGLARRLVGVFESALGAEEGTLSRSFEFPTTFLRLLHYPPQDPTGPDDEFGSNPHTDYGFLTILAQDSSGGLQVRAPDGETWLDAPPRPGAFVLNVGDIGERWSNGTLRSTPHRVLNRAGRDRYSIPYFFDPAATAVVAPLPACVPSGTASRYEAVTYGDYLLAKLNANHSYRQPAAG
ncbi:2OG-Fe(II) oxygenase family protein [Gaiella sp.]|uniref:isopenicillin N synthase family dioxygenase n=1 Tax=Gaiella sp. TaxID=2663207 RepID=UPI0032641D1F